MAFVYETGITVLLYVILGLALNLLMGYAGQLSMAHAAFFGIGAYTAARLVLPASGLSGFLGGLGWAHGPALIAAMLMTFVFAAFVSVPARRIRGEYLVLLTIAFQIVISQLMVSWTGFTGGPFGLASIPPVTIFGKQFVTPSAFFWLLAGVTVVVFALCWGLAESPFGRVLKGIREDETAVRAVGKNVVSPKIVIFGITAAIAGGAGAAAGFYYGFIAPDNYTFDFAVLIVAIVALGGSGNLWGTVLGALIIGGLPAVLENVGWISGTNTIAWQTVIYGLALTAMMVLRPSGLLPEGAGFGPLLRHFRSTTSRPRPVDGFNPAAAAAVSGLPEPSAGIEVMSGPSPASSANGRGSTSPSADAGPAVEIIGLRKAFGGIIAVDDITMRLHRGWITALIGPNGAGKTTVFNLITGTVKPDAGQVILNGREITGWTPERITRQGMTRSFQDVRLFQRMSALENVALAIPNQAGERPVSLVAVSRTWREQRQVRERAESYLEFVGVAEHGKRLVSTLSFAEQKMVAIARLLATECDVLLLDEPTSGIDSAAVERVNGLVLRLRALGKTICLVEHSVHVVEELAEHAIFLGQGRVIAEGTMESLTSNTALAEVYFGA